MKSRLREFLVGKALLSLDIKRRECQDIKRKVFPSSLDKNLYKKEENIKNNDFLII